MSKVTKNNYCATANPMVDTEAITSAMESNGISRQELADMIGVSLRTIHNRLTWGNWYVAEAWMVSEVLKLDFVKVFLAHPERLDMYPVVRRGFAEGVA